MSDLRSQFSNLQLLIIGDGPERGRLEQKIKLLSLENIVKCTGGMPKGKLFKYLCAADLFVLNTDYEGFSHQIIEAMASGAPVITTRIGGNPEIITHEKDGLLIDRNDPNALKAAIQKLLMDEKMRITLAAAGKERAKQFSPEPMLMSLKMILDQVCGS